MINDKTILKRDANIELLRIISMLMVILLHSLSKSDLLNNVSYFSFNYFAVWFLEAASYVAVNIYVIISGYFLCKSKFKLKKIFTLIIEILFYSILSFLIAVLLFKQEGGLENTIKSIFPVLSNIYWFATTYIGLIVISPLINIIVQAINKKQHFVIIIIGGILFALIPNIIFYADGFIVNNGYSLIWFIYLYFVAAYLRNYFINDNKKLKYFSIYIISVLLCYLIKISIDYTSNIILKGDNFLNKNIDYSLLFYKYNSILILIASISLFLLFLNIRIKGDIINKIILKVSSATFGIYLIHDAFMLRNIIWFKIFKLNQYYDNTMLILYILICVILIFSIGTMIELIRQILFKPFNKITVKIDLLQEKLLKKYLY